MQAEPPFTPPALQRVPMVPETAEEDPPPEYIAPTREHIPELELPALALPDAPTPPPRPPPYHPGEPKHGKDWTGERPQQFPLPVYARAALEEEPELNLPWCTAQPPLLVRHSLRSLSAISNMI
jgi:hypothetical protein